MMKMRIIVTEPTTMELDIPGIEAFTSPEVFDHYKREVRESRNGVQLERRIDKRYPHAAQAHL